MSPIEKFPCKIVFEEELDQEIARLEANQFLIIEEYLTCFDQHCKQKLTVPQHILEAIAQRFQAFIQKDVVSLDAAFGGSLPMARKKSAFLVRDKQIIWDLLEEHESILEAKDAGAWNEPGTPSESAFERVAARYGIGIDAVKKIHKRLGKVDPAKPKRKFSGTED